MKNTFFLFEIKPKKKEIIIKSHTKIEIDDITSVVRSTPKHSIFITISNHRQCFEHVRGGYTDFCKIRCVFEKKLIILKF